ncbi:MAG TPA: DsbA family protein [Candidatus Baltobacteraceae bacterium]|jgi:predicted DsbA family dithiol-disulfide isomerase
MSEPLKITYYFDVLSQWCYFADRALDDVRREFGDRIDLSFKVKLINDGEPLAYSPAQLEAIYGRSKAVSGIETTAAWLRPGDSSLYANLVVEAVRGLGGDAERTRRRLSRAALEEGVRVGTFETALQAGAEHSGYDAETLAQRMREAEHRVRETTAEFHALPVEVVPALILRNAIGDTAILSGLFERDTFATVVREMLRAGDMYERYGNEHPELANF